MLRRNIVIGPPGTGKTTFLKKKVDRLINEGHCRPDEIGYFSFTVKAAEEIPFVIYYNSGVSSKS